MPEPGTLAPLIDHTSLRPETTEADVERMSEEARRFGFAAVCVNPVHVRRVARALRGSEVATAAVVGFPLGADPAAAKVREAEEVLGAGASEIDMVVELGAVRSGAWAALEEEVGAVVEVTAGRALVKVILETAALAPRELLRAARVAVDSGADFLKTSTGFHPAGGATPEAVALLALVAGPDVGVKAAGGIRTPEDALAMVSAGATRLGTSRGLELLGCRTPLPGSLHGFLGGAG